MAYLVDANVVITLSWRCPNYDWFKSYPGMITVLQRLIRARLLEPVEP